MCLCKLDEGGLSLEPSLRPGRVLSAWRPCQRMELQGWHREASLKRQDWAALPSGFSLVGFGK